MTKVNTLLLDNIIIKCPRCRWRNAAKSYFLRGAEYCHGRSLTVR